MAGVHIHNLLRSLRQILGNRYQSCGVIIAQCYVPPEQITRWCKRHKFDPSDSQCRTEAKLRRLRAVLKKMGRNGTCDMRTNSDGQLEFKANAETHRLLKIGSDGDPRSRCNMLRFSKKR